LDLKIVLHSFRGINADLLPTRTWLKRTGYKQQPFNL
jgi:hypothetical protein